MPYIRSLAAFYRAYYKEEEVPQGQSNNPFTWRLSLEPYDLTTTPDVVQSQGGARLGVPIRAHGGCTASFEHGRFDEEKQAKDVV